MNEVPRETSREPHPARCSGRLRGGSDSSVETSSLSRQPGWEEWERAEGGEQQGSQEVQQSLPLPKALRELPVSPFPLPEVQTQISTGCLPQDPRVLWGGPAVHLGSNGTSSRLEAVKRPVYPGDHFGKASGKCHSCLPRVQWRQPRLCCVWGGGDVCLDGLSWACVCKKA